MPTLSGRLASIIVAACLLTGCQPPAPTPSPLPSYRCTPEAGGAEFDCSRKQYDDMVAKDKLYAEAEAVYRRFFEEDVRIFREGGITKPTPVLLETTTGDFQADSMALYSSFVKEGRRSVGGDIKLARLDRVPGASKGGSLAALRACVDASTTTTVRTGRSPEKGGFGSDLLYFGRSGGVLKIQGADGEAVESC